MSLRHVEDWGSSTDSPRLAVLIFATVCLLVPFLALGWVNYTVSRELALSEIRTSALPLTRDNIFSEIHTDLLEPLYVSMTMAHDSFLKEWALSGEESPERVSRYLTDIHRKYGYLSVFYVSARTMRYYHFERGLHKVISPDNDHDQWFYNFVAHGQEYEFDVDNDEASNHELTIFMNFRVEGSDGELLGVTGVGMKMATVSELLRSTEAKYSRRIFLVDREGVMQVHTDRSLIGRRSIHQQPGLADVAPAILRSFDTMIDITYTAPTGPVYLTARYIPEFDWFLVVEQDESAALAGARQNFTRTLIVGVGLWALLTAVSLLAVRQHYQRLARQARTDNLTGLGNRTRFEEDFGVFLYRQARHDEPFSLVLTDLDGFKQVNDRLGHMTGDVLLREVAAAMHECLRPTDRLARWGGDEFIVLTSCAIGEAEVVAQRLRQAVTQTVRRLCHHDEADPRHAVTISCGVVEGRQAMSLDSLIQHADTLLYECKKNGGDGVVCAVHSTHQ